MTLTKLEAGFIKDVASATFDWDGQPLFGEAIDDSPRNKGLLMSLKKKRFVTTFSDDGCVYIQPTRLMCEYCEDNLILLVC